jgi:hypothetical protein
MDSNTVKKLQGGESRTGPSHSRKDLLNRRDAPVNVGNPNFPPIGNGNSVSSKVFEKSEARRVRNARFSKLSEPNSDNASRARGGS